MASPKYQQVSVSPVLDDLDSAFHTYNGGASPHNPHSPPQSQYPQNYSIPQKNTEDVIVSHQPVSDQSSNQPPLSRYSLVNDWWLLEILGACLSVAWLAAVVGTLYAYKDKPLSSWTLPIKLNSLISLFTTLAKASILLPVAACINQLKWRHYANRDNRLLDFQTFDNASRGPLGAFELILQLNRASILASFAAFITIAALAIDPFAQQILAYPSQLVSFPNNSASILQTQKYDTGLDASNRLGTSPFTDIQMQGSIYRGIFGLPQANTSTCPTGNCDWQPFTTFGVCSECSEVTDNTQRFCYNWTETATGYTYQSADPSSTKWPLMCNYTTPSNFNLQTWSRMNGVGPYHTIVNSTAKLFEGYDDNGTIASVATFRAVPESTNGFSLPMGEVTECRLYWCAKTYENAKVRNGNLDHGNITVTKLVGNTTVPYVVGDCAYDLLTVANDQAGDFKYNASFTVNRNDWANTAAFLRNMFNTYRWSVVGYSFEPGTISISSAIAQASTMDVLMSNVAGSMTDRMRAISNGTSHFGDVLADVSYIHVRWAWLGLPAFIIVSGCVLLAILIGLTSKPGSLIWQSSSLAPMFHGLHDGRTDTVVGHGSGSESGTVATKTNSDMNQAAKDIKVRLIPTGPRRDEWKLVKVD